MNAWSVVLGVVVLAATGCGMEQNGGGGEETETGGASGDSGSGSAAGDAGSGGTGTGTSECPPWPRSKLFPYVGPWFFTEHPGPCSMATLDDGEMSNVISFVYDGQDRLSEGLVDGSVLHTFTWSGDRMVATDRAGVAFEYVYEPGVVRVYQDGEPDAAYHLDANGYPTETELDMDDGGTFTTRLTHEYEDCRLVSRSVIETDRVGSNLVGLAVDYTYGDAGDLAGRYVQGEPGNGLIFDFFCW